MLKLLRGIWQRRIVARSTQLVQDGLPTCNPPTCSMMKASFDKDVQVLGEILSSIGVFFMRCKEDKELQCSSNNIKLALAACKVM
jgi:hypothetical protein